MEKSSMNIDRFKGLPEWAKNVDPHSHAYPSYLNRAVEKRQLDEAVELNDTTAHYLYNNFTPTQTCYEPGTRPFLEQVVQHVCDGCDSDIERALRLVMWRRANYRHVPKCGLGTEEEILLGGYSMCHDASRCLITLCQVAGMGARMIIGLNDATRSGHTLTEIYAGGKWIVLDPSAPMPFAALQLPEGTFAGARDIQLDPSIPDRCRRDNDSSKVDNKEFAEFFTNCRLTNWSLEDSTKNMARRFVHMAAAMKVIENYDYIGHLEHQPIGAYADFDQLVTRWLNGTNPPRGNPDNK